MKAVMKFHKPQDIAATISLTMTMEQWGDLRERLKGAPYSGPAHWLREAIDDLHQRAARELRHEPEDQA